MMVCLCLSTMQGRTAWYDWTMHNPLADRFQIRYVAATDEFIVMDRGRPHRGSAVVLPDTAAVMRYVRTTLEDEGTGRAVA